MSEGDVPIYRLTLQLVDDGSSRTATVTKRMLDHEAQALVGTEVRILVHPDDPGDVVLDD